MIVTLTPGEVAHAKRIGASRQRMHEEAGHADAKVMRTSGASVHVLGALGELAVARALGLRWDGAFFPDAEWQAWRVNGHDVSSLEVRSTPRAGGRLLIQRDDEDHAPFVLVRGHAHPQYEVVGWLWGGEGKRAEWWRDVGYGRPCFFVPNERLLPLDRLAELAALAGA